MTESSVSVEHLSVRLGTRTVLEDVHFDLPAGSMLAVLGPNGSGKSTLLRTLLGLVHPAEGTMRLGNEPLPRSTRGDVGYVPQIKSMDRTFPARARELIASQLLGRWPFRQDHALTERIRAGLGRVGADHLLERPLAELSGGELQRVYLARALICRAALIILDEPETGIDVVGSTDLHTQLEAYRRDTGASVIMATHDWDVALHHSTHALLLRNRQIAFGSPAAALTESCVRAAFGHVGHTHAMVTGHAHDHHAAAHVSEGPDGPTTPSPKGPAVTGEGRDA